ncbi:MAG: HEAT repeat domain-containing protein [Thermodesulfovibrio sp.]|nr:HEAT repeat domain-containing protein [Thermodesulfovibrio sp.]MDW7971603.1 HEAT repeat domain-containing protein [Thermodesulfovibrio sp.]
MSNIGKNFSSWDGEAFEKLLFDYLDRGYLENIITFFKHEPEKLNLIPKMLTDERVRLRLGAFAILEELKQTNAEALKGLVPSLIELLNSSDKKIRADACYALEIIGDSSAKAALYKALSYEEDPLLKEFMQEAIKNLE